MERDRVISLLDAAERRPAPASPSPIRSTRSRELDPMLLALSRYVQALHQRYPDGLDQMRSEGLASRANMPTVTPPDPAA